MEAIAERADVARATVFNHYADKQELLRAYLGRRRERLGELLRARSRQRVDAVRQLYDAFELLAAENERNPPEARELVRAWWRTGGNSGSEPNTDRILAEVIVAGQQRGELRTDIDAPLAGRLLFDAYAGVVLRWVAADDPPFHLSTALRDTCTIMVGGLRAHKHDS